MKQSDMQAYERAQTIRTRKVCVRLRRISGLTAAAEQGAAPVVAFTCPSGHRFRPVRLAVLQQEFPGNLHLEPLPGDLPKRARIDNGSPFGNGRSPCLEPGCPTLMTRPGLCTTHGGRQEEQPTGQVSSLFTCRECGWRDTLTDARLLEIYGNAVLHDYPEVALNTGRPTRRR